MQALGFPVSWCELIMKCVSTVSFSIRVNDLFSDSFKPSRGIRQGDPISPYLFLLCSEELSCMLRRVGPLYISRGVRVSRYAPWISHLLFADDCLVFTQATKKGAERVAAILDDYNKASGQLVNKNKSVVFLALIVSKIARTRCSPTCRSVLRLWVNATWDYPRQRREVPGTSSTMCLLE